MDLYDMLPLKENTTDYFIDMNAHESNKISCFSNFALPLGILIWVISAGCAEERFVCNQSPCNSEVEIPTLNTTGLIQFETPPSATPADFGLCGNGGPLFDNRFSPYRGGSQSVDLVVEHYSALHCPHCAHFAVYVDELLKSRPEIDARVRFYFHHYPFNDYWHYHMAAFAISQQSMEKFWQFHDILYRYTGVYFDYLALRDLAMYQLDVDMTAYDAATSTASSDANAPGNRARAFLEWEKSNARAHCVTCTPAVYLCGHLVDDWQDLENRILKYLR
jgi:hypothetical protein